MRLERIIWCGAAAALLISGCGRQGGGTPRETNDATKSLSTHAPQPVLVSNTCAALASGALRQPRMQGVARALEDFSASLGLQAKSFTLHPELRLVECSNVFELLPDEEFLHMIADFYEARGGEPGIEELQMLREIIDRRIQKNIGTGTPGDYGNLLLTKLQTYYRDCPDPDYAGFLSDTLAAMALVRTTHAGDAQLNDFVVETLAAAGGAYPMLQYLAMRHGGNVQDAMVPVIDREISANTSLSPAHRELLTDVKYHCLVITDPDRVIKEGRAFLAGVPIENHFSLALFVEGLEKGLRGEALAQYRTERIRAALRKQR